MANKTELLNVLKETNVHAQKASIAILKGNNNAFEQHVDKIKDLAIKAKEMMRK